MSNCSKKITSRQTKHPVICHQLLAQPAAPVLYRFMDRNDASGNSPILLLFTRICNYRCCWQVDNDLHHPTSCYFHTLLHHAKILVNKFTRTKCIAWNSALFHVGFWRVYVINVYKIQVQLQCTSKSDDHLDFQSSPAFQTFSNNFYNFCNLHNFIIFGEK